MSKILIIFAHPNHDGHHGYFLKQCLKLIEEKGCEYELIDLYAIGYDPVLKPQELYSAGKKEVSEQNQDFQKKIKDANRLLFIYPTWWSNMPAILKGWLDRVFVSGFGFIYKSGIPIGQLKGKKAAVFTASGSPRIYSFFWTKERSLKILTHDILHFCGIKTKSFRFGSARQLNEQTQNGLKKIARRAISYLVY